MPQPTRSDIHVNRPLTNMSVATIQDEKDFIADKVFPIVPVQKQSDLFFVYDKGFWTRSNATKRAPGTETAGGGYGVSPSGQYFCHNLGYHQDVTDDDRANADDPLNPDVDATEFVTRQLLLKREQMFFQQYLGTGIWQGFLKTGTPADFAVNTDGSGYWDSSTSNPILDIGELKRAVKSQTGYNPNKLVVTENVFYALCNNPNVVDRIKYTQRGVVSEDLLAALFKVDEVLVAGAVVNSAQENQPNQLNFMARNSFLLVYANPAPALKKPSGGYIFTWTGRYGSGSFGNRIKKFRMEHLDADRIEGEMSVDFGLVSKDLGVLGTNVCNTHL